MDAVIAFYRDELGFELTTNTPDEAVFSGPSPNTPGLQLYAVDRDLKKSRTGIEFHVTNFEAALKELGEAGYVIPDSCSFEERSFRIADPAGNQIIFRELMLS
ncbi:hypothetical protein SAMN04488092_11379 [Thalassovita taeanensis]|jgi:catechol 2,3-dioxygenase-like lactoylglutathione lyase family enzyme|uniref:Glyoxalase-like domain-containing protein n=2 Tax=Thalassovita taeanensis TaxID=657014 RepID=A0A1H9IYB6_9RHOB|nr:hypothetical protein SAMN04488092_11379 [Thalassovita taeanensis]